MMYRNIVTILILLVQSDAFCITSVTKIAGQRQEKLYVITEKKEIFSSSLLNEVWGKRPMLIRDAFHVQNSSILWPSWESLMELTREEEGIRLIRHIPGNLNSFTLDVGPWDNIEDVIMFHNVNNDVTNGVEEEETSNVKWTLVFNDVDRFFPALSDWMDRTFSFLPRWRRDDAQVSLADRGGGIGPHVDNYDVFLIQTQGTRQWHVKSHPLSAQTEHDMTIPDMNVRILSGWDEPPGEIMSFLLEPGDVLYLPPRYPHWGIANTDHCMTLSVGCHAPSATDLVAQIAEQLVNRVTTAAVSRYQDLDLIAQPPNHLQEITNSVKDSTK
jgi:50S ribosomal protein L16 3-hydroxylase